jgi:hypothetical protein
MQNDPEEDNKKVKERAKARTTPTKKKKKRLQKHPQLKQAKLLRLLPKKLFIKN